MSEPRDSEEFVRELTRSQSRLRGFIRCLLLQHESVEDVLQETNLVLWRKAGDFTPGSDFWAWASQVARFQVLTYLKQRSRDRHVFDPGLLDDLADLAIARATTTEDRQAALARCLEQLPPAQRQLLELRYALRQSNETIAASTNRPVGSIRQTLYRIREVLLKCIERRLAAEGRV
jgi:RNA polymerase sigma-70 factor, ECF subfamily